VVFSDVRPYFGSTRHHCAAVCDSDLFVVFGDDELGLRVIGSIVFGSVGIVAVIAGLE
jgi:hypothetical protein